MPTLEVAHHSHETPVADASADNNSSCAVTCSQSAHAHHDGETHSHHHSHSHVHEHHHDAGDHHHHEHHHHHHHDHDGCSCCCDDDEDFVEAPELAVAPTFSWPVIGLDCPSCARETQEVVKALPGVAEARLVYATATLEVAAEEGANHTELRRAVLNAVRSRGQDLQLSSAEEAELDAAPSWWHRHRETVLMGASGIFLMAGLIAEHLLLNLALSMPLYIIAAVFGLVFIAPLAAASLARRSADMNVLMGIAVIGGLALGFAGDTSTFADAAIVIFLDQVGEWLEGWSMRKTSGSIRKLMELAPDLAHVVASDGTTSDVDAAQVALGTTIRVLPGERVPLDGIIAAGTSAFNEAAVTGESVPADKGPGASVYAGTLNTTGAVDITVNALASNSTLARVVAQVQGAQANKAPYESFVDRFAAVYTPLVVGAAAIIGLAVPTVLSFAVGTSAPLWHDWIYRALSRLVVACPCALVISTPVSFVSAITRAAHDGVLVKGGGAFDVAAHLSEIAFDKTGTLTTGNPALTTIAVSDGVSEREVLGIAAALEAASTHPLARAVVQAADERGLSASHATNVIETAAAGVAGTVDGVLCTIGKPAFVGEHARIADQLESAITNIATTGATVLVVAVGEQAIGVIGVADTVRSEAAEALHTLHNMGVATTMLTGDHAASAAAVARALDVTSFVADLLPEGKVDSIRTMQDKGVVAMVGDGINDAPALATADLGITMGAAASDTALDVADVALLGDDLASLPHFLALSRRTMRTVRINIAFAIVIKALVFVAVIAGVAGMGLAVFSDTGVALLVILNGMHLMFAGVSNREKR